MIVPKRIIISRTDSIGDVILTLPVAGYLRKHFPDVHIAFLGADYTRDVVDCCAHVDEFISWDQLSSRSRSLQITALSEFDTILHVYPHKRIASLAQKAGIQHRVGTSHRLYHLTTCNHRIAFSRKKSDLHEAELNFKLLKPLGVKYLPSLDDITAWGTLQTTAVLDPSLSRILDGAKTNIILHPKSKGSAAEWPLQSFMELCEKLSPARYNVFITGTADDGELIGGAFDQLGHVRNLCGKMTLATLIQFIASADALVACSTGPLHIAAALGKKAVGLYAPIRPIFPQRWRPIGPDVHVVCSPLDTKKSSIEFAEQYLQMINPEDIIDLLGD